MRSGSRGGDDPPRFPIVKILNHYEFNLDPDMECWWQPVRCEFHGERTASASVNTELGLYVCHSCDMSGRAEHIIMKKEGIGYREACARAESITGVSSSSVQSSRRPGSRLSGRPKDRSGVRKAVRPGSRLGRGRIDPS